MKREEDSYYVPPAPIGLFAPEEPIGTDAELPGWLEVSKERRQFNDATDRRVLTQALVELARKRAARFKPEERNVCADDLHRIAKRLGIEYVVDRSEQRKTSWYGPFLRKLAKDGVLKIRLHPNGHHVKEPSKNPQSHGNPQDQYYLPSAEKSKS